MRPAYKAAATNRNLGERPSELEFVAYEGGVAQIWGDPKDYLLNFRPQPPIPGQLVECCGTGMGSMLACNAIRSMPLANGSCIAWIACSVASGVSP